jgi:hypothetical protein
LVDQLGIERIAIVGWSDGAITGLEPCHGQTGEGVEIVAFGVNETVYIDFSLRACFLFA